MRSCGWYNFCTHIRSEAQGVDENPQTLIVIIIGILSLGLIWRIVKGMIRFVFMIGFLLLIGYLILHVLR